MKIIRDEEYGGIMMIPLFVNWRARRCNVSGCRARPTTILTQMGNDVPLIGLCEAHFQQGNVPGGCTLTFEWDDYDAFAKEVTCQAQN